jgi:hypothetical protein
VRFVQEALAIFVEISDAGLWLAAWITSVREYFLECENRT